VALGVKNSFWRNPKVIYSGAIIISHYSADFYKDRLTDEQLEELENPKTTTAKPKKTKGSVASHRRRPSRPQSRKVAEEEEKEE
jgi:hypothetical protein